MTDQTIAEIAGKLTAAQREALVKAIDSRNGWLVLAPPWSGAQPWPRGIAQFYSRRLDLLTPTGLAVRAYLQEQDEAALRGQG